MQRKEQQASCDHAPPISWVIDEIVDQVKDMIFFHLHVASAVVCSGVNAYSPT
jgi:hypothetical protein